MRPALKADLLLLTTAAIWGAGFVAQRVGMEHMGPFLYNGLRFALGALALSPLVGRGPAAPHAGIETAAGSGGLARRAGLLAGAVLFMAAALQQAGLVWTTAGKAGFITGLYVPMAPLMGLALGQRVSRGVWLGVALTTAGLFLLSVTEDWGMGKGDALVLVGAVFWALHVMVLGHYAPLCRPVRLARDQFAVCAGLSLAAALALETEGVLAPVWITSPTAWKAAWGAVAFGGLLSVGLAYTLQVVGQREAPPSHAAVILSLESVFAVVAGVLFLGEAVGSRELTGCGLMLAGMLAAQLWPPPRNRHAP